MITDSHQIGSGGVNKTGSPALQVSGVIPAVLGFMLSVGGICVGGTLTQSECSAITAEAMVLVTESHQIKANGVPVDSRFQDVPIRVHPASKAMTVQQVRPPVKDFIKRVVVPILVERYIARLNRDRLLARTEEAS